MTRLPPRRLLVLALAAAASTAAASAFAQSADPFAVPGTPAAALHDDTPHEDKIVVLRRATWADYQRLLEVVRPDRVSILSKGRIVRTGGPELAQQLESEGYDAVMEAA